LADEIKRIIVIWDSGNDFVFAPVHNIQYDAPLKFFRICGIHFRNMENLIKITKLKEIRYGYY